MVSVSDNDGFCANLKQVVGAGAGMAELTALAVVSELAPTRKRGKYVAVLIFSIVPFVPSGLYAQLIACMRLLLAFYQWDKLTVPRSFELEICWHHRLRFQWHRLLPYGLLLSSSSSGQFEGQDESSDSS